MTEMSDLCHLRKPRMTDDSWLSLANRAPNYKFKDRNFKIYELVSGKEVHQILKVKGSWEIVWKVWKV